MFHHEDTPLDPLSEDAIAALTDLVERMQQHDGPWGEWAGGEKLGENSYTMPFMNGAPITDEAMTWLYDQDRIIRFNWPEWDEGRLLYREWTADTLSQLDHPTVCKLLTAVARQARFSEGAWEDLFEGGKGVPLLARLLEHERVLKATAGTA